MFSRPDDKGASGWIEKLEVIYKESYRFEILRMHDFTSVADYAVKVYRDNQLVEVKECKRLWSAEGFVSHYQCIMEGEEFLTVEQINSHLHSHDMYRQTAWGRMKVRSYNPATGWLRVEGERSFMVAGGSVVMAKPKKRSL